MVDLTPEQIVETLNNASDDALRQFNSILLKKQFHEPDRWALKTLLRVKRKKIVQQRI